MNNITELNTKPFKKKEKVFLDKEFEFTDSNKLEQHKLADKYCFNKAILERDRKYHIKETENSFQVNYKNKMAEMLR